MAFTPLTKDQYQKAIDAGFSPDTIIKNEKTRKQQSETTNAPPASGGGFWSGIGNAIGKASDATYEGIVGAAKSIPLTLYGGLQASEKLFHKIGLTPAPGTGSPWEPQNVLNKPAADVFQPKGKAQEVGKVVGDIAQFFIPGGQEKAIAKAPGALLDTTKLVATFGEKGAKIVKGIVDLVAQGGATATTMGGVTAAQTGGNLQQTKSATTLGFFAGVGGKLLEELAPGITKSLQKADFKLSPAQEAKAAKKSESAAKFMSENKILGSGSKKYEKLNNLNQDLESTLQSSLPSNLSVPKQDIIDNINSRVEVLRTSDPAIYRSARKEADEAINLIRTQGSKEATSIPIKDTLSGKRSWGKRAFNTTKAAVKDPRVSSEGAYAAELGYESALENTLAKSNASINIPGNLSKYFGGKTSVTLPEFNKVYSDAITSKNLTFTAQFKKDSGLVGRLFGLWVGESVGQAIAPGLAGKIIGGTAGEMLSTRLPGFARGAGERAFSMPGSTIPNVAKGSQAISNQ